MKRLQQRYSLALGLTAVGLTMALGTLAQTPQPARQQLPADSDWKFLVGDPAGPETVSFSDSSWRTVNLPHDWSIEAKPDPKNPSAAGAGFFPGGVGWYRKTFNAPASWSGKRVSAEFDGVYMDATVYLNGEKLGTHPYGYTGFRFDLTPHLKINGENVLAVRVDNSAQPNTRWYSGSGIYRHVRLVVTEPVHVAHWGVFVTTPEATAANARVAVRTRLTNESKGQAAVVVQTLLTGPNGSTLGQTESPSRIAPGEPSEVAQEISVANPALWSPQTPALYRAVTRILIEGKLVDEVVTPFGIRSIAWSMEHGLQLNGKSIKLAGGSVHHDNGPLGAAAFDRAEERKVELLKAAGFNAVRTAHNPPSTAFLDACDRLGLLVLDEPFDVWTSSKVKFDYARFFGEWWQRDIDAMVLRDRNHPSIIIWGIGNEIPEAWTKDGAPIARKLAARVRELDGTRPLTEAFPGATYTANTDAVFAALDIGGYNYNLAANGAKDHQRVPNRIMMTTESLPGDAFQEWQMAKDNAYILGEFVWTAMDYLGESGIGSTSFVSPEDAAKAEQVKQVMKYMMTQMGANGENPFAAMANPDNPQAAGMAKMMSFVFPGYPWHASNCGDVDLAGFRKPQSFYRDILWNGGDRVFATVHVPPPEGKQVVAIAWGVPPTLPSWTWPGQEGKPMQVDVYSGADKVRLYLNDKLIGETPTGRDQHFKATFSVPYASGTLRAVGVRGDHDVAESVLITAGEPTQLRLTADRAVVHANGEDLSFIIVEALDANGRVQPNAAQSIGFELSGPGSIAAVGNGDGTSDELYQGHQRKLYNGRALVVVRTSTTPGEIQLKATTSGLKPAQQSIMSQVPAAPTARL
jgi:beta-galactosidase